MTNLCLFLKPKVTTSDGQVKQGKDIKTFIKPAIIQAGLSATNNQIEGIEVYDDISDDIVHAIYKADILVIDANCYETSGVFLLSPYLYYYMAIGHSRGNATILVTSAIKHLPPNLNKYHTLTYSLDDIWGFIEKFKLAVEEIQQRQNEDKPDNPIQVYLNQEELANARRRIAEMEAERERQKQGKPSIVFTRVN